MGISRTSLGQIVCFYPCSLFSGQVARDTIACRHDSLSGFFETGKTFLSRPVGYAGRGNILELTCSTWLTGPSFTPSPLDQGQVLRENLTSPLFFLRDHPVCTRLLLPSSWAGATATGAEIFV